VEWLFEEPSVVLVAVTLAAVLFVVEMALPTLGLAGLLSFTAAAVALGGLARQDLVWWPLFGTALAVIAWLVLIIGKRRSPPFEIATVAVVAASGIAFGVLNDDAATIVVAVASAAGLWLLFPVIHGAFVRITGRPAQAGTEAFVGQLATVDRWDDVRGVVQFEGSRWNAAGPHGLRADDLVVIVAVAGSSLTVARPGTEAVSRPPMAPPTTPLPGRPVP